MSEEGVTPSENNYLKEVEEAQIIENLRLLRLKLIARDPDEEIDDQTATRLFGIRDEGGMPVEGGLAKSIKITYDTHTGQIKPPEGEGLGEYSRISTSLIDKGEGEAKTRQILLYRQGGMPSPAQYANALMGTQYSPYVDSPTIFPERIDPANPRMNTSVYEIWGQSDIGGIGSIRGDIVMLKTIRKFNETYGPER